VKHTVGTRALMGSLVGVAYSIRFPSHVSAQTTKKNVEFIANPLACASVPVPVAIVVQQDGVNRLKQALRWQDRREKSQSWRTYFDKNNVHHASRFPNFSNRSAVF
jgi:hypothetical protein